MFKNAIVNQKTNFISGFVAAALLLINPLIVHALGLGSARIISKLNEPLNIEVELLTNNSKELQGILPNLASPQDFEEAGIDRANFLNTVEFKVEQQAGKPIIRLTTKDPVKEPVVNVLVELNSTQGRLLKDYTVLLDPPELTKNTKPSNPIKNEQKKAIQQADNNDNQIFDAFNQRLASTPASTRSTFQQDTKQQELNQALQARLGKIEKQLSELEAEKTLTEQAKHSLEEENNNLHDLVESKQKEITQLKEKQQVADNQPVTPLPSETAPKTIQQRSELSHFAKTQILAPTEENLQNTMPSSSAPWLLLGLILTIMLSAVIGLREFLKRKEISLPFEVNLPAFSFDLKENTSVKRADNSSSVFKNNQQVNQQAFQNAISLIKAAEEEQKIQTPKQIKPIAASVSEQQSAEPVNLPTIEDAEIYITFSKFKMAEDILVKILDYQVDNIKARLKLIDLFLAQNKINEAKEQFNFLPANFATHYAKEYQTYQERLNGTKPEPASDVSHTVPAQPESNTTLESISTPGLTQQPVPQESLAAPTTDKPHAIELDPTIYQTKLDFAKVYIDMNDMESARDLLNEVIQSNFDNLKAEAQELLEKTKK